MPDQTRVFGLDEQSRGTEEFESEGLSQTPGQQVVQDQPRQGCFEAQEQDFGLSGTETGGQDALITPPWFEDLEPGR